MLIPWSEVKMSTHAPLQRSVHSDDAPCCCHYCSNLSQLLSVFTRHSVTLCKPEVDDKPTANATDQRMPPTRHQPTHTHRPTYACIDGGTTRKYNKTRHQTGCCGSTTRRHSSTNSVKMGSCIAASRWRSGQGTVSRWQIIRTRCRFASMSCSTVDSPTHTHARTHAHTHTQRVKQVEVHG